MGLLDRLMKIAPSSLSRFFFVNSGSEAVDQAVKIARGHTGRQNIICFEVWGQGGFHSIVLPSFYCPESHTGLLK